MSSMRRVVFVANILTHYRAPFHTKVRALLASENIEYRLVAGRPEKEKLAKGDTVSLGWAREFDNFHLGLGSRSMIWQPVVRDVLQADLAIFGQENRHLINYFFQSIPRSIRPKIALFGHGRNFQARNKNCISERWKRYWATKCDWWFAYTEETKRHLNDLGYPDRKITVFNNAVDTSDLTETLSMISPEDLDKCRQEFRIRGRNVCIFVGGLYPDKRLSFLIEAADRVKAVVDDFELIIVGSGEQAERVRAMSESRPWLAVVGPRFGREKAELMAISRLFLMPGLVGLAVLDAAAAGLPLVTTDYPWHSPEIAYLTDGKTGLIVKPHDDVARYSSIVSDLLLGDDAVVESMSQNAKFLAGQYTIDAMANRFAAGVRGALDQ